MGNSANSSPRGSLQDFSRAGSIELFLNGSCSRCHHWFDRHPIRVSRYASRAQITRCTNCHRRFFALGGNSTHASFNSQSTIGQSPVRESSSRRPPVLQSALITSPLQAVNEVATLGILRTDPRDEARSGQTHSPHPRYPTSNLAFSPYNAEEAEAQDQTDQRRSSPASHRPNPVRPMAQAAKEHFKKAFNRIRKRHTARRSNPIENRVSDTNQHSDLHTVQTRASRQLSGSAESSAERSSNRAGHHDGSHLGQQTEEPAAGTCLCGDSCPCATSSSQVGTRSSESVIRMRDSLSGSPVSRSLNRLPHEANVSRLRAGSLSMILAHLGAWAESRRSSMIDGSGSSGDTPAQASDHRCIHSCQFCCRRMETIRQVLR
ncbi:MAG: hypothetical protein M1816_005975 [Peltula sp. TS41687]|nr:MAG: hypothetical protein M1816_005975 [Peltula sp. TS41687]